MAERTTQVIQEILRSDGGAGDQYWSNVVLLIGANGADASKTFIDESSVARSVTADTPGPEIDTAQSKFGGSSALFNGTGRLATADSADWDFGAGQFTIEAWIRPNSVTGTQFLVCQWNTAGTLAWNMYLSGSSLAWNVSTTGSDNLNDLLGGTLVTGAWQHIAISYDGTKYRAFLDGVMVASSTTARTIYNPPAIVLAIGINSGNTSFGFNGWLDEIRITKGVARYASDGGFAVPTAAFPRAATGTALRSTQVVGEVLRSDDIDPNLRATQVFADVLRSDDVDPWMRSTMVYMDVLRSQETYAFQSRRTQNIIRLQRALAIYGTPILTGTETVAYTGFTATAIGGIAPIVYSLVGTWPAGLSINSSTGVVSGTPTTAGTYTGLSVRATDDDGATSDLATFTITVAVFVPEDTYWYNVVLLTGGNLYSTSTTNTILNPSDKNAGVTLSSGSLVATNNNNTQVQGVRAIHGKSTGKYYWEVYYTVTNNVCDAVGLCKSTYDLSKQMNSSVAGDGYVSIAPYSSVRVWVDGTNTTISDSIVSGSLMCVAVDLDAHLIWYRKGTSGFWNVGGSANPATGVGGITIPSGTLYPMLQVGSTGSQLSANFGDSAMAGVLPSGYTVGWPSGTVADGSTIFIDESPYARALTAMTSAQVDTTQSKFGGSSIQLNGAGDYVTAADSTDWDFGTDQFTIEGWFRFTTLNGGYIALIQQWSGGWALYFDSGQLFLRPGTGSDTTKYTWSPTLNTWYHIAIDRDNSNAARIYVDGAMVSKTTSYTVNLTGSTAKLALGSLREAGFSGYDMAGWMDEVRITKGIARYASDSGFTVPTAAFPRTGSLPPGPLTVLTGVIGWWDASVTASLSLTGSDINSIADQSTSNKIMTAPGTKPTYSATGFNGTKPAIVFAGNGGLQTTSFPLGTGVPLTFWTVCTMGYSTGTYTGPYPRIMSYMGGTTDHSEVGSFLFARQGSTTDQMTYFKNGSGVVSSATTVHPAPHRMIVTVNSSGTVTGYIDGVVVLAGTKGGNWTNNGTLKLGSSPLNEHWSGPLAEAGISTDYHDATAVAKLDLYLRAKWGFP
jgi:hypothetical protein